MISARSAGCSSAILSLGTFRRIGWSPGSSSTSSQEMMPGGSLRPKRPATFSAGLASPRRRSSPSPPMSTLAT